MNQVDKVFIALAAETFESGATVSSKRWITTKELAKKLNGVTTTQAAQGLYLLRNEGSVASRPSTIGSMYEHTALYAKRKKRKKMERIGTPRKSTTPATKTTTIIVPPPTDALEALLNATASIERELKELRKFKDKVTSILGDE